MSEIKTTSLKTSNRSQRWKIVSYRLFGDIGVSASSAPDRAAGLCHLLCRARPLVGIGAIEGPFAITTLNPLAFGSWETVLKSWKNINAYQHGEIWLWFTNSIVYVVSSLLIGLAIGIPAGYALSDRALSGRKLLLWLTLITMLLPPSAHGPAAVSGIESGASVNTAWAVILPASFFPFGVYLTYVYYSTTLPSDLLEAAGRRLFGVGILPAYRATPGQTRDRVCWPSSVSMPIGTTSLAPM